VYVYDGVYRVIESWIDVGKSSIGVYKFKLRMIDNKATMDSLVLKELFMFRRDPLYFKHICVLSLDVFNKKLEKVHHSNSYYLVNNKSQLVVNHVNQPDSIILYKETRLKYKQ
jgi:hypothetical protein